jgi:UDP-N-acetylglucosamine pyrophosphorylase
MASPSLTTNGVQAFENTSTNVAASQMRNALNKLADTVQDPSEKKVSNTPTPRPTSLPYFALRGWALDQSKAHRQSQYLVD